MMLRCSHRTAMAEDDGCGFDAEVIPQSGIKKGPVKSGSAFYQQ